MPEVTIKPATTAAEVAAVRELLVEYGQLPSVTVCLEGFADELANLPGTYAPPGGTLLIASAEGIPAGCVALCQCDERAGEMRRMYVRPEFRGRGLGRALANAVIATCRRLGYARLYLDTLPSMTEAIALYRSLGFRSVPPHGPNPAPGALFFELDLETTPD